MLIVETVFADDFFEAAEFFDEFVAEACAVVVVDQDPDAFVFKPVALNAAFPRVESTCL